MKPSEIQLPLSLDHVGRPNHFDPDHYLDSVEQMICADEIVTALYMLDNLPGYYRDNPPKRAAQIKSKLFKQIMTVTDYASDKSEGKDVTEQERGPLEEQWKDPHYKPRGEMMVELVKELNEKGFLADIHEFGPANYWLPAALKELDLNFKHTGYSITDTKTDFLHHSVHPKVKTIFCCFEVIEHLWNMDDIYHYYAKSGIDADYVLIGCPKYTLYGGLDNWESRELGHIRTLTPTDLFAFCRKNFPGYSWASYEAYMMVCKGEKK